jgi:hypothetical protein
MKNILEITKNMAKKLNQYLDMEDGDDLFTVAEINGKYYRVVNNDESMKELLELISKI